MMYMNACQAPGHAVASAVIAVVVCVLTGPPTSGQCLRTEDQKILASNPSAGDIYAAALEVEGDLCVIANEWDDDNGTDSGSAFIYRFDGTQWVEEQKIKPSDGAAGDNFGRSVDISGDVVVVGAHWDNTVGGRDAGSAYVFRYNGTQWVQEKKLRASDGAANDRFGLSVSVDGNVIMVGAWKDDNANGVDAGAVYVFEYDGSMWNQEQKLLASDGAAGDDMGRFVDLEGSVVAIGAWGDDDGGTDSGSAYVFRHNGSSWVEEQKLTAGDAAAGDRFSWEGALSGNRVAVAAYEDDTAAGVNAGSCYIFEFDGTTWSQSQKLTPRAEAAGDRFGNSVSIDGDRLVVGAGESDTSAPDAGVAYFFQHDGSNWQEEQTLTHSDAGANDAFGFWVSIDDTTVFVGDWKHSDFGTDTGAAYVFDITDLLLVSNQSTVMAGDTLTQTTCGGLASNLALLVAVDVNGISMFYKIALGLFDALGEHSHSATIPSGLSGLNVKFLSLGFDRPGQIDLSNVITVLFQ